MNPYRCLRPQGSGGTDFNGHSYSEVHDCGACEGCRGRVQWDKSFEAGRGEGQAERDELRALLREHRATGYGNSVCVECAMPIEYCERDGTDCRLAKAVK